MGRFVLGFCALIALGHGVMPFSVMAANPEKEKEESSKKEDDPRKFFQFHMEGITASEAKADYSYCSDLSSVVLSNNDTIGYAQATGGGLIGGLIEGIQKAVEQNRMERASLRKCMAMFGYDRYLQAEPDYNLAHQGEEWQATVASGIAGPRPTTERLPQ